MRLIGDKHGILGKSMADVDFNWNWGDNSWFREVVGRDCGSNT